MLPNLLLIFLLVGFNIKCIKKLFIDCFAMSYIIDNNTIIILDILKKLSNIIEFEVVKS